MMTNPYQAYRTSTVETASPVELVALLYQGLIRFTQRAIYAIEQRDIQKAHDNFLRAQAIVVELISYLDVEAGGEVAQNLGTLYDYCYRRLVEANCQKQAAPAEEVVGLFRELLGAWQTLAEGKAASPLGEGRGGVPVPMRNGDSPVARGDGGSRAAGAADGDTIVGGAAAARGSRSAWS